MPTDNMSCFPSRDAAAFIGKWNKTILIDPAYIVHLHLVRKVDTNAKHLLWCYSGAVQWKTFCVSNMCILGYILCVFSCVIWELSLGIKLKHSSLERWGMTFRFNPEWGHVSVAMATISRLCCCQHYLSCLALSGSENRLWPPHGDQTQRGNTSILL